MGRYWAILTQPLQKIKKISYLMKKIIFLLLFIGFASCNKNNDNPHTTLNITTSQWYLTRTNYGGGFVNLKIAGSTNGDKVTVRTYGDGLISDENVELDSKKNFNKDITISFTATSVPSGEFEVSTKVVANKGTDTLVVPLNSGKLKY
jgi:hypothetical protein